MHISCARCACSVDDTARFEFRAEAGTAVMCSSCALQHAPMLRRSLAIAAVVGTVLVVVNQGDLLVQGVWISALAWKIPLTYAVPFTVATVSALINNRIQPSSSTSTPPIASAQRGNARV